MKELTIKDLKRVMYERTKNRKKIYDKKNEKIKISDMNIITSKDEVIVDYDGKKYIVPSIFAFKKLSEEYKLLKNNYTKTAREVNVLRETIKILIRNINELDNELKRKIDKND